MKILWIESVGRYCDISANTARPLSNDEIKHYIVDIATYHQELTQGGYGTKHKHAHIYMR